MGSAVSDRKADGSALKARVFPHRPTVLASRSRSGRVPFVMQSTESLLTIAFNVSLQGTAETQPSAQ